MKTDNHIVNYFQNGGYLMCKKLEEFWNSLDRAVVVNKRELVLGVTACTLAGVLMGMLLSPRKTVSNGSNNTGNSAGLMTGDEEEKSEDTSSGEEAQED